MTGNKKVLCKVCYKEMRSDILTRHMKVHETNGGSKRKHDEMDRPVLKIVLHLNFMRKFIFFV